MAELKTPRSFSKTVSQDNLLKEKKKKTIEERGDWNKS